MLKQRLGCILITIAMVPTMVSAAPSEGQTPKTPDSKNAATPSNETLLYIKAIDELSPSVALELQQTFLGNNFSAASITQDSTVADITTSLTAQYSETEMSVINSTVQMMVLAKNGYFIAAESALQSMTKTILDLYRFKSLRKNKPKQVPVDTYILSLFEVGTDLALRTMGYLNKIESERFRTFLEMATQKWQTRQYIDRLTPLTTLKRQFRTGLRYLGGFAIALTTITATSIGVLYSIDQIHHYFTNQYLGYAGDAARSIYWTCDLISAAASSHFYAKVLKPQDTDAAIAKCKWSPHFAVLARSCRELLTRSVAP